MTVDIHPDCRERLVEQLAAAIAPTVVSGHQYPDSELYSRLMDAEDALPDQGPPTDQLVNYINERPLVNFVFEQVHQELRERFEYDSGAREELTEIEGYTEPEAAADRLISELESLPWQYELMLPLPLPVGSILLRGCEGRRIELGGGMRLEAFDQETVQELPQNQEPEGPLAQIFNSRTFVAEGQLTVVGEPEGYVGKFTTTRVVDDFKFKVRAILGVLFALRLLATSRNTSFASEQAFRAHRLHNGERQSVSEQPFSAEFTRVFRTLSPRQEYQDWPAPMKIVAGQRARTSLQALFRNEREHESLIRGAQWLFDSYCSGNNLLAFVQTAVSMEILVGGDKQTSDLVGLSNLIGNRCAYLIADSRKAREQIIDDFQDAYEIRSRIVHEGKSRLNNEEQRALGKLRWMCYRVIQEELDLVANGD